MNENERHPMTPGCKVRLRAELRQLKDIERPKISKAIELAREHGDLSENADYDAAKEAQGISEARIRNLEAMLSLAEVIDPSTLSGDRVMFGATVKIEDSESGEEKTYTIVGEEESDIKKGRISIRSPIARALIGKTIGDEARFKTPGGMREVEVIDVQWLPID